MHELAICGAIADIAARRAPERRVQTIHVRIGQLRQVVPDTLVYCWGLVTEDTELDGALLEIENVRARVRCAACGADGEIGDIPVFVCPQCSGVDVTVVAGEEFTVTALDLVRG